MQIVLLLLILCFFYPTLRVIVTLILLTWYFGWKVILGILVAVVGVLVVVAVLSKMQSTLTRKSKEAIMMRQEAEALKIKDIFKKNSLK